MRRRRLLLIGFLILLVSALAALPIGIAVVGGLIADFRNCNILGVQATCPGNDDLSRQLTLMLNAPWLSVLIWPVAVPVLFGLVAWLAVELMIWLAAALTRNRR